MASLQGWEGMWDPPDLPELCSFHWLGVAGEEGTVFPGGAVTPRGLVGGRWQTWGQAALPPAPLCVTYSLFAPPQHLPAIISRYVPFAAVAAANCINIPLMRQR